MRSRRSLALFLCLELCYAVIHIVLMAIALSLQNLKKVYPNGVEALKGISLDIAEGDFFALLGPNGAGKTTAIGVVAGLVNKTSGTVKIFEDNIDLSPEIARSHIGIVPQEFNFSIFEKVIDIVVNQAGYYGIERAQALQSAEALLKQLELWGKRHDPSRMLSGGMKRRLMIARALVHKPRLLILDEPSAGVDIEARRGMWDFLIKLSASGTTIILTTHYLEEAEQLCKNVAIINHGQIVEAGPMRTLLGRLKVETFVFYIKESVSAEALKSLSKFKARSVDELTIEADVEEGQSINDLVVALTEQRVTITSMRNKANRLEEIFLHLTSQPAS